MIMASMKPGTDSASSSTSLVALSVATTLPRIWKVFVWVCAGFAAADGDGVELLQPVSVGREKHRANRAAKMAGVVERAAVFWIRLGEGWRAGIGMLSMIGGGGEGGEFEGSRHGAGEGERWGDGRGGLKDAVGEGGLAAEAAGGFCGFVFCAAGEGDGLAAGGGEGLGGLAGSGEDQGEVEQAFDGAEGAGDEAEAGDGAVRAGERGEQEETAFGEGSGGLGDADGAGFEAGFEIEAATGVAVGLVLGAVEEPGDGGALAGDGLVDAGVGGPDHFGSGVLELHEEVGVFAGAFVEAEVEAEELGVLAAEEDVVGLDEGDGGAGGEDAGGEEVAVDDPGGCAVEGGDDGAADDVGVVGALDGEEGVEPEGVGGLVVVEEGDEVGSGGLGEGAVAGVGEALAALNDVVGGEWELVADELEGGGAGALDVVVDEDEFELDVGVDGELLGGEREQGGTQHHGTLVREHADGDGRRARAALLERSGNVHRDVLQGLPGGAEKSFSVGRIAGLPAGGSCCSPME